MRNVSAALARRDYDALVSAVVSFREKLSPNLVAANLGHDYGFDSGTDKPSTSTNTTRINFDLAILETSQ